MLLDQGCLGVPALETHAERIEIIHQAVDAYARERGLSATYAAWHPKPEYRFFKTGSLDADLYPSGLILVDDRGNPHPWKPTTPGGK